MKMHLKRDKENIETQNIKDSKNYIINSITNIFLKEFEKEDNNKDKFSKSLTNYMIKFTDEFMIYSQIFINSFKENSQKIIKNYNVNENKLLIEYINFIVIGNAGTGKSTFINQSLLLPENKRAKEDKGVTITEKSILYSSEKLKMIRMWDTQGLDHKISQNYILNEAKRLDENGLKKGPDHYINIILYCTYGNRFQEENGELIHKIIKLYPMDNLPVIITQLQAFFEEDAKEMEDIIRKILSSYLEKNIVEKIEIKSVVSRDKKVKNIVYKTRGIPELLRCSFDVMGRAITSATFKKFSEDIEQLCKDYVDKKINFIQQISKDEMEIIDIAKYMYVDDSEKYFNNENKTQKNLSSSNIYKNITEKEYFTNNFIQIVASKFLLIFNNLNNTSYSYEAKERPLVLIFIQERLEKLQKILNDCSKAYFEKQIYEKIYIKYFRDLWKQQNIRSKVFNTKKEILDESEIEKSFKEELF